MYIPNDDTQNYPFSRLELVVHKFEHSTKWTKQLKFKKNSSKILSEWIRKHYYKTLETSVINIPMSPMSKSYVHPDV